MLLLDLESKAFKQRERDEEEINGKKSGRLRAEYEASIAICRDIVLFSRGKGKFELKVYDIYPKCGLIIIDPKTNKCRAHISHYPERARGYSGKHTVIYKAWVEKLDSLVKYYEKLWNSAKPKDIFV